LLFRWFIGRSIDAPVWDVTVFTKNRERLLSGDVATQFLSAVLDQPRVRVPDEHFSVSGTLIEAWASLKSFQPKDGSGAPPGPGAMLSATFVVRAVRRRMPPPPMPRPSSIAKSPGT
jgi:hypothetical protein